MAKLKDHPILFNQTEIYYPSTFSINYRVVENVVATEAGTDVIQLTRIKKLVVNFGTNTTSEWVSLFEQFYLMPSFTLSMWNAEGTAYETYTVRMRNFSKDLIKKSHDLDGFNGLWKVSFSLEEF